MTIRKGRREGGFTMIELIIVIVILGILAIIAIPRFLSFSVEAEKGTAKGITAAIRGTVAVLHSQFLLTGATYNATAVWPQVDVQGVALVSGGTTATAQIGSNTYTWTIAGPTLPTTMAVVTSSIGF